MIAQARIAGISQLFRQRFPQGTPVNVLPAPDNHIAQAVTMAGMRVVYRPASQWPNGQMIDRLSREKPSLSLVGANEIRQHDMVRDYLVAGLRSAGHKVIIEVTMDATLTNARADADLIARAPKYPGAADQTFYEVKTGRYADIRPNQGYVYSLALVGGHVTSRHSQLAEVGLPTAVPLPAMDFIFVDAPEPDRPLRFALVLALEVDQMKSIAAIMAYVAAARSAP